MTEQAETIEDKLRRIDEQVAQAAQHAEKMQTLAAQIRSITTEVSSPGGEITVKVDVSGRLTDIRFGTRAFDQRPEDLTRLVLDALSEGYRRNGEQSVALAAETLGDASATVAQLRESVEVNAPAFERGDDGIIR